MCADIGELGLQLVVRVQTSNVAASCGVRTPTARASAWTLCGFRVHGEATGRLDAWTPGRPTLGLAGGPQLVVDRLADALHRDALLRHGVALAHGHVAVLE